MHFLSERKKDTDVAHKEEELRDQPHFLSFTNTLFSFPCLPSILQVESPDIDIAPWKKAE